MVDFLPYLLIFYLSTSVSFALYSLSVLHSIEIVSSTSKSSKSRKVFSDLKKDAALYLKLSILWPVVICLMSLRKIRD